MKKNKYPSKYSNGKEVSAAQYITELICERKALIDKIDLHYRFWTNKVWSSFYRNQIASAHKLLQNYSDKAIVRALCSEGGRRIYSLRAPSLKSIIEKEQKKIDGENTHLTIDLNRPKNIKFGTKNNKNKSIFSKLKDIDNDN
jgi:hypothetical protein